MRRGHDEDDGEDGRADGWGRERRREGGKQAADWIVRWLKTDAQ